MKIYCLDVSIQRCKCELHFPLHDPINGPAVSNSFSSEP